MLNLDRHLHLLCLAIVRANDAILRVLVVLNCIRWSSEATVLICHLWDDHRRFLSQLFVVWQSLGHLHALDRSDVQVSSRTTEDGLLGHLRVLSNGYVSRVGIQVLDKLLISKGFLLIDELVHLMEDVAAREDTDFGGEALFELYETLAQFVGELLLQDLGRRFHVCDLSSIPLVHPTSECLVYIGLLSRLEILVHAYHSDVLVHLDRSRVL